MHMLEIYHCVFNVDVTMAFPLRRNAVHTTECIELNFMGNFVMLKLAICMCACIMRGVI